MLAVLPHGVCVDPDTVKIINVRTDRQPGSGGVVTYTVVMKTEADDGWISVAAFDNRAEAEALSKECARRINGGEDEPAEEEEEEAKPAAKAPAAKSAKPADDDDW